LTLTDRQRQERVEKALERLPELAKLKVKQGEKPGEVRASSTDSEAKVMKIAVDEVPLCLLRARRQGRARRPGPAASSPMHWKGRHG